MFPTISIFINISLPFPIKLAPLTGSWISPFFTKYPSDTATKLILERTTIKSLEYLGNEVIWEYPYLADEVKQKLGGIKFVKQVDGGYGTLVGAVIVYVALLDYKYESNPKTTKELEGRIKDCITD